MSQKLAVHMEMHVQLVEVQHTHQDLQVDCLRHSQPASILRQEQVRGVWGVPLQAEGGAPPLLLSLLAGLPVHSNRQSEQQHRKHLTETAHQNT